jgi:uncharacterized protein
MIVLASPVISITTLIPGRNSEGQIAEAFEHALGEGGDSRHLATVLIEQEGGISFLVSVFPDDDAFRSWQRSPDRKAMVARFDALSLRQLCAASERAVRISVPSDASGPKWKLFASTWSAIFPILLVINITLAHLAPGMALAARLAVSSLLMSAAVVWVISPWVHRITRTWRLRGQQTRIREPPSSNR